MYIKLFISYFFLVVLTSCNYKLFVNKDAVIKNETGIIFFSKDNDYFIPYKLNRVDNYEDCLKKIKRVGFLLSNYNRDHRFDFIKMYCDTVNNQTEFSSIGSKVIFIAPVNIKYYSKFERNSTFRKTKKMQHQINIKINGVDITLKYNTKTNYVINILPFYTKSKIYNLENIYLEKSK